MQAIYEPKGRAEEYAPLAVNLYDGCGHGCTYCYCPEILKRFGKIKDRAEFHYNPKPRKGILKQLRKDTKKYKGHPGPVLLCFMCDPYSNIEEDEKLTQQAIKILGEAGMRIRVLTKNGSLACRDIDLFAQYNAEVGTTITVLDDRRSAYEPGTSSVRERKQLLINCHEKAIKTWLSLEPVLFTEDSLAVIATFNDFVDMFRIGKLNHGKTPEPINWKEFLQDVLLFCHGHKAAYYIKDDLWAFADAEMKATFPKEFSFGIDF